MGQLFLLHWLCESWNYGSFNIGSLTVEHSNFQIRTKNEELMGIINPKY